MRNDAGSVIQLPSVSSLLFSADLGLAGQPIPTTGPLPSGIVLAAGLYAGTSSSSLDLVGRVVLNPVGGTGRLPGIFPPTNIILPFAGGSLAYFQVKVWDAAFPSYEAQLFAGVSDYSAVDNVFTMTPGSASNPSILNGGGSTWAAVGNETPMVVVGYGGSPPDYDVYVTMQPTNQAVLQGGSATFAVAAHSGCYCVPLSYHWQFNGTLIPSATNQYYQITNAEPTSAGVYAVNVSDISRSVLSSGATLTVLPVPPSITSQPQSQTNVVGSAVDFLVTAFGTSPLSYQWLFNGAAIPAASGTDLHLDNVQVFQAGLYSVAVTNALGAVTSSPAVLTVLASPPSILAPPSSQTAILGWSLDLTVSARGALPLSYQWLFDGNAISGASEDALHLANVQLYQSGTYSVIVTNAFGAVTSAPAVLSVIPRPPNPPAGTVVGWGDLAIADVRPGTRFKTIAAGSLHSLAIASDGTVIAWGNNGGMQCAGPTGMGDVVAVAGGGYGFPSQSLVLRSDGTVAAWGDSAFGSSTVPPGLSDVIGVSAGVQHNLALKSDGTVVAWGDNTSGQTNIPRGLGGVVAVAAGGYHSLALEAEGNVVAWGDNSWGQTNIPAGLGGVTAVAAAYLHSLALKSDGTVVSWGLYGQTNVPAGLAGVIAIAAKGYHSLALKSNGTVVAWGDSNYGPTNVPTGLSNVVAIAAGEEHNLALKSDGTIIAWGANDCGQSIVPGSFSGIISLASGGWGPNGSGHISALKSDGTVLAWGRVSCLSLLVPANLSGVTALAEGECHGLALKSDGTVVAWGDSYFGQTNVPTGLSNVLAVAAGGNHSLAVRSDGTVAAWGDTNDNSSFAGQSIVPTNLSGVTAVAGGEYHSLALKSDGTVAAWGSNKDYSGNYAGQSEVPPGLRRVVAIAAGGFHSLALKSDGTVVAWGNDTFGQSEVPLDLSGVVAIAAGQYHSLALKVDGTIVAWGTPFSTAVPASLPRVTGIFAGGLRSVAVVAVVPVILTPPASRTVEIGSTVRFGIRAAGYMPLAYQWYFNGTNVLGGATNSILELTDVDTSQIGAYTVVVTNVAGAASGGPALLNVIPLVQRKVVPALLLSGQSGSFLNLDEAQAFGPSPAWVTLDSVALTNTSQWYFDLSAPLPPRRFYRAWQSNSLGPPSSLNLYLVPALTLAGTIGNSVRIDYINQLGPIDAWVTLATVTLTNTTQLYFDISAPYQPPRLWRIVPVP
jgi:alpha-tubulin suppressor-like RCC1 family protein